MCAHVCIHVAHTHKAWSSISVFFSLFLPFFLRQSLSLDPEHIIQRGWLTTELKVSSCLHSHHNYDHRPEPHAYFWLGAGDPNLGLFVCVTNALWTGLFSHPWQFCSLVENVEGNLSRVWSCDLPNGSMTNFCLSWFLGGKMKTNLLPFPAPSSQFFPASQVSWNILNFKECFEFQEIEAIGVHLWNIMHQKMILFRMKLDCLSQSMSTTTLVKL